MPLYFFYTMVQKVENDQKLNSGSGSGAALKKEQDKSEKDNPRGPPWHRDQNPNINAE